MEINWSTFLLEIVNFLVLVWILKHFLYRPVLDVIARRRADIEKALREAETMKTNAEALRQRYDNRLSTWETERKQAREELAREIDEERAKRMAELRAALDQERERARVVDERRLSELQHQYERTALNLGARFATRLLESAASPELQARLLEKLLEDLSALPAGRAEEIIANPESPPHEIRVTSAFQLSAGQRRKLEESLETATGLDIPVHFDKDPALIAGLRLRIGAWELALSLQDELKDFAKLGNGS